MATVHGTMDVDHLHSALESNTEAVQKMRSNVKIIMGYSVLAAVFVMVIFFVVSVYAGTIMKQIHKTLVTVNTTATLFGNSLNPTMTSVRDSARSVATSAQSTAESAHTVAESSHSIAQDVSNVNRIAGRIEAKVDSYQMGSPANLVGQLLQGLFSQVSLPNVPTLPTLPTLPSVPQVPSVPSVPTVALPSTPAFANPTQPSSSGSSTSTGTATGTDASTGTSTAGPPSTQGGGVSQTIQSGLAGARAFNPQTQQQTSYARAFRMFYS